MDKKKLLKALRRLSVARKTTMPSLRRVLIQSANDGLLFRTTDIDLETSVFFNTKHPRKVDIVVDLKGLIENIKSIYDDVDITLRSKSFVKKSCEFTVHAGDVNLNMEAWNRNDFPALRDTPKVKGVNATREFIDDLMELRKFAANKCEIRASLTGVYCDLEKGNLVATNGHVLGIIKNSVTLSESVIIPESSISRIKKLLSSSKAINIKIKGTILYVVADDCYASVRLVEGPYPPYKRVIPGDRHETLELLVLDSSFIEDMPDRKKLESCSSPIFNPTLDNIKVDAVLRGETSKDKPIPWNKTIPLNGSTITFRLQFNPDLLKMCCKFIGGDVITLEIEDGRSGARIKSDNRLAVIMPTRLPD